MVLRTMVRAFIGEAAPVGSQHLVHLLPTQLSSASVRTILAELAELGLVAKPHASSGRVPTDRGLRLFVDRLLDTEHIAAYERRTIAFGVEEAETVAVAQVASQLLSERSRQLGFVVTPRLDRAVLRHISLVRLSTERLLVILVTQTGNAHRRVVEDLWGQGWDQHDLDVMAALLSERVFGRTLAAARGALLAEAEALRDEADAMLWRAIELGRRAVAVDEEEVDLVIETRLALLDQPEFRDPQRIRDLFEALETKVRLLEVLDQMLETGGVNVVFGDEVDEPGLRSCALVATPYGGDQSPLGMLGVIGPARMDYGRMIPLVDYFSQVMTHRLRASE